MWKQPLTIGFAACGSGSTDGDCGWGTVTSYAGKTACTERTSVKSQPNNSQVAVHTATAPTTQYTRLQHNAPWPSCNLPQLSTTPNKRPHTNHGGNTVQSPDDGKQSGIRRCTPLSLPICAFGCVMHGRTSKAVAASAPPSTLSASSAATVLDSCEAAETGVSLAASGSGFFLCRFFAGDACVTTVGLQHLWMPPTATPLVSNPTKPLVWCGVVWFEVWGAPAHPLHHSARP